MAKRNKKVAPARIVTVKSKAYGKHQRAARGTYKEATLNPSLRQSGDDTAKPN